MKIIPKSTSAIPQKPFKAHKNFSYKFKVQCPVPLKRRLFSKKLLL
jgi:hypothetical protein